MSVPVALTLEQPIFGVKTNHAMPSFEPVRYAEAKAAFLTATEEVTISHYQLFFQFVAGPRKM